jgi:hypothetical protein
MVLSQSVASELLEAFRAGEGVDLIRESVRLVMRSRPKPLSASAPAATSAPRRASPTGTGRGRGCSDPGRRSGAADSEAAEGLVLPRDLGAAAAD